MLNFYDRLQDMDFAALMAIYVEGNQENAAERYPQEPAAYGIMLAEQDFYQYLRKCFFPAPGARYAVWVENGMYVSALRLEPYQDGLLLEALETKPEKASQRVCQSVDPGGAAAVKSPGRNTGLFPCIKKEYCLHPNTRKLWLS